MIKLIQIKVKQKFTVNKKERVIVKRVVGNKLVLRYIIKGFRWYRIRRPRLKQWESKLLLTSYKIVLLDLWERL